MRRDRRRRAVVDPSLVGPIRMPESTITPLRSLLQRLLIAVGALVGTALIVYFGRDGFLDNLDVALRSSTACRPMNCWAAI